MKHMKTNGGTLNLNKKICHLKRKQLEYIKKELKLIYISESKNNNKKDTKDKVLQVMDSKIKEKGIWLPFNELEKLYNKKVNGLVKLNKKDKELTDCKM